MHAVEGAGRVSADAKGCWRRFAFWDARLAKGPTRRAPRCGSPRRLLPCLPAQHRLTLGTTLTIPPPARPLVTPSFSPPGLPPALLPLPPAAGFALGLGLVAWRLINSSSVRASFSSAMLCVRFSSLAGRVRSLSFGMRLLCLAEGQTMLWCLLCWIGKLLGQDKR